GGGVRGGGRGGDRRIGTPARRAGVEGGKSAPADAGLDELDASSDAGGGEVAIVALDRFQRLLFRPPLQPRLRQCDGDVVASRFQFGRLAQRELVAGREQLLSARGDKRVKECFDS